MRPFSSVPRGRPCGSARRLSTSLSWLAAATLLVADAAAADIIRFRDGTRMRGTITKRTPTEVIVQLDFGTASFAPGEIVSVEPDPNSVDADTAASPTPTSAGAPFDPASLIAAGKAEVLKDADEEDDETPKLPVEASAETSLPEAMEAVAFIATLFKDGSLGVGSGTIINAHGIMVTNAHVVHGASKVAVLLPGRPTKSKSKQPRSYEARVLKLDECYDLAIVSAPVKTPHYLRFSDEESPKAGDEVRAIGNPQGLATSVSKGIISAVRTLKELGLEDIKAPECEHLSGRSLEALTLIQTDAAINPGNSGGPLLNAQNEVVGINTLSLQESGDAGLNFALHVKHVKRFVGSYAKQ